jgi:hypothetical protein
MKAKEKLRNQTAKQINSTVAGSEPPETVNQQSR